MGSFSRPVRQNVGADFKGGEKYMRSFRSHIARLVVKYWMSPKFNTTTTVQEQRIALEAFARFSLLPRKTRVEPLSIGRLSAEWISVGRTYEDRAILYLHGGAYNIGSLNTHRDLAARISKASNVATLLIDYRLAPEYAHPAAVDDVVMAYHWLIDRGYRPENIIIAGDSSGGGLAVAALVSLRNVGTPLPAAIVCLSPWADLKMTGESLKTKVNADPFLTTEWLQFMAGHYVADSDSRDPLISPIYADLHSLPPMLIQVGSDEILLSDSIRLAERASESGIDTTIDIWPDLWHVWHFFAGQVPEGNHAVRDVGRFIHKHLNLPEKSRAQAHNNVRIKIGGGTYADPFQ
jgi:acetyl esterase/lipase